MAPLQRHAMRQRQAFGMAAMLILVLLTPLASSADSTVSVNTTWSGSMTLTGNVTVASGATLTIAPGASIDAKEYALIVEGTLEAEEATFFSSVIPITQGSHGQGLWPGIVVESGGSASLANVTVANASAGVLVKGDLAANDLVVNDAYRGLSILGGEAVVQGFEAHRIDYEALYVETGALHISDGVVEEVAVGLANHAEANVSDLTVRQAGVGIQSQAGTLVASGVGVFNASVGIATLNGAQSNINSVLGTGLALVLDLSDADDFTLVDAQFTGERFAVGQGATGFHLHDLTFAGSENETRPAMDVSCQGTCTLTSTQLTGVSYGISWSGSGTYLMDDVQVTASTLAVQATGSGHAQFTNISLESDHDGMVLQTPTSTMNEVAVHVSVPESTAIDVLGGTHDWGTVAVHKPFLSSDSTSLGVNGWFADIDLTQLTARNLSTGVMLEDSNVILGSLEANIGSHAGLHLVDSTYQGDTLTTVAQDEGVLMEGHSTLHLTSWTAQLHDTPLMISSDSHAVIRSFTPMNTAPTSSDALGDGTLYYGSTGNPSISTTVSYELLETDITLTNLEGAPVQADVSVHGLSLVSNSNGALTLPLVASGSVVDATLEGAGVRTVLYGGQTGQSIQVPVIPQGDWTVNSGQEIVLGPRPDAQPHTLTGDLTISNNAKLTLRGTTLIVPEGSDVTLLGTGWLAGEEGALKAPLVQASGQSMLTGTQDDSLTLESEVQWGCMSQRSVEHLNLMGNLTVQPGCDIVLTNGYVSGNIVAQTGASFTSSSILAITVLDKGVPVDGATISVEGSVGMTDAEGQLTTTTTARSVTDTGETWGGIKTVTLQSNTFTDFVTWDTNQSLTHTFMASTLPSGEVSGWLVLERQWSPYTLEADLVLQTASTMTIQDGVSLRISEGTTITVNGVFDAEAATLSSTGYGARWGGLALGPSTAAVIDLSGTQLVEASPALTVSGAGEVRADGVFAARSASDPLMIVETGSATDVDIRNSRFQDSGSGCVNLYPSAGLLTLSNVTFASCDGTAIWAQQVNLDANGLVFEAGVDHGLELTDTSGRVNDIDAMNFDGSGAIVSMESMQPGFTLSNLNGMVSGTGGIIGQDNEGVDLQHITLQGAPAIDLDLSSGTLSDLTLIGPGSGTALTAHHGRSSDHMIVERMNVSGFSVGISLHSDEGEISAPLIVRDSNIIASNALATEHHPARLEGCQLVGALDIIGSAVEAVDGQVGTVSAGDGGSFSLYRTITLDAQRAGLPVSASFTVTYSEASLASLEVTGTTLDVELLLRTVSTEGDSVMASWTVQAEASGSPPASLTVDAPTSAPSILVVVLQVNQPPVVSLIEPFPGQRVMEGDSLRASADFADDLDSNEDVVLSWKVYDLAGNTVLLGDDEPVYNITDLSAGFYIVEVTATDTLGMSASASMDFEYTLLDTDEDWSSTCSSESWFDPETGKSCGPNIYDQDDDNDGFSDEKDAFPLDPCAQVDTDGDTQPDVLDCPPGYSSWLTEDMDDDGDGTPDVLEGVEVSDNDTNLNALLLVLASLVVLVLLFFARLRRGGPGDLASLDQRHL